MPNKKLATLVIKYSHASIEYIKKTWHDPVLSTLYASAIMALIAAALSDYLKEIFFALLYNLNMYLMSTHEIKNWKLIFWGSIYINLANLQLYMEATGQCKIHATCMD